MSFLDEYYGVTLIMILLLFMYISFQSIIEHKKIHLLHETGFGILIGFILGLIIKLLNHEYSFSGEEFFKIILPPIIFAAGYNLKKRKFFSNITYIALFAVIGTLINFFITLFMTRGFLNLGWIIDLNGNQVDLSIKDILYYSTTMCASDAIAALTLINSTLYPKLFSVVFGEGLLNDAVAIILFDSVQTIVGDSGQTQLNFQVIIDLLADFLKNCVISVLIGLVMALLATYISKKFRSLMEDAIKVNVFILLVGYASYCIGELINVSSVIAVLTAGVIMNHYMRYNLNEVGLTSTTITVSTLSQIAESFLFVYLGLSSWTYISDPSKVSLSFIGLSIFITIVSRFGCIYVTSGLASLILKEKWGLNRYELSIIWFSGLIRGAVAFALIQLVEGQINHVIVSTILFIVFITTVILGAFMSSYVKFFTNQMSLSNKVREKEQRLLEDKEKKDKLKNGKIGKARQLEENFLKPLFIYNYEQRKESIFEEKRKKKEEELENCNEILASQIKQENQPVKNDIEMNDSKVYLTTKILNQSDCISGNEGNQIIQYNQDIIHSSRLQQNKNENNSQSNKDNLQVKSSNFQSKEGI